MNMTKEQIGLGLQTGLELLGPESDISIPAKMNDGVFLLKQLLASIAQGRLGLVPTTQEDGNPPPPGGGPVPPKPTRNQRRVAKKASKKKTTKKK